MADEKTPSKVQLLTDSLTIAAASAFSYLLSFLFEEGYADHFGIPATFITPSVTTVLIAGAAVAGVLFWLVVASPLYSHLWVAAESNARPLYRFILRQLALVVAVEVAIVSLYGWTWGLMIFIAGAGLLPYLLSMAAVVLTERNVPLEERIKRHAEIQANDPGFALFDRWVRLFGPNGQFIVMFFAIALLVAYGAGQARASRQEEFLVLKSDATQVLLRTYGDLMIFARVDRAKRRVTEDLTFMWLSEKKTMELTLVKLGSLPQVGRPGELSSNGLATSAASAATLPASAASSEAAILTR